MNFESKELLDWEILTIDALATEALDKRISQGGEIRNEDAWLEIAIRERQNDARAKPKYRAQLQQHAERLGIGTNHPKRDWQAEEYDVAPKEISARWCRIIGLVLSVDTEHEWRELHRELVTRPLLAGRQVKEGMHVADDGLGVLEILEIEAKRHGLINDEPAPDVDTRTLAQRLLATLGA